MIHYAAVIDKNGTNLPYSPTFQKGDRETIEFAQRCKEGITTGLSIAVGENVTLAALKSARRIITDIIESRFPNA